MGRLIGIDEAGLGPNLGPLVIVGVSAVFDEAVASWDFWQTFDELLVPRSTLHPGERLQIGDSKELYQSGQGFKRLETIALSLLQICGWKINRAEDLISGFRNHASERIAAEPWFDTVGSQPLPLQTDTAVIQKISMRWKEICQARGVQLSVIADVISTPRFNASIELLQNKSWALSQFSFGVLAELWSPDEPDETLIQCDKHGGRNRYDDLLTDAFPEGLFLRQDETSLLSQYRCNRSTLRFEPRSERYPLVALASIVAKYLRELHMFWWNEWWQRELPGIRTTAGYPTDAKRFARETESYRKKTGIGDNVFWRAR